MRRLLLPASLALLLAGGCGWKRELALGNSAAERNEWVSAAEHYQAAVELNPEDKALQARLAEALDHALAGLVEQAGAARDAGQPEAALDLLDQAEALLPRQLPVALLREEIVGAMAGDVRALLAAGDDPLSRAHSAWLGFAERFPVHPETARLRDEIAAALQAEVQARVDAGDFAQARAQLRSYAENLPVDRQLEAVEAAWSDALVKEAADAARRRQPATAWVAQALAAGLSGDPALAAQRDAYRDAFDKAWGVVVGPRMVARDRAAMARLDSRLQALFQPLAARWAPGAPRAAIGGRITIGELSWNQSAKATVAVHEYPGPEREHDNPAFLRAQAELEGAEAALGEAQGREKALLASRAAEQRSLEAMRQGLAAVELSLQGVREAFAAAEGEVNRAQAALDESVGANSSVTQLQEQRAGLEATVAEAQALLDQAVAGLDAAGTSGGDVAAANQAVGEARRAVEDARAALDAAPGPTNLMRELARHVGSRASQLAEKQRLLELARAELEARQAPVQDQLDAVARLELRIDELGTELEGCAEAQAQAQRDVEVAQARLAELPPTIFGPVIERVEIPVQSHLRSAEGSIELELQPSGSVKVTRTLKARAETRDEERPALAEHGLEADPLEFPESDAELQARVEAELAKQLRTQLEAQLRLLVAARVAEAQQSDDPEQRLRALLQAWLLAPSGAEADPYAQPEAGAEAAEENPEALLKAVIEERWGLGELGWLRGTTVE
jgi:hypothetical protein